MDNKLILYFMDGKSIDYFIQDKEDTILTLFKYLDKTQECSKNLVEELIEKDKTLECNENSVPDSTNLEKYIYSAFIPEVEDRLLLKTLLVNLIKSGCNILFILKANIPHDIISTYDRLWKSFMINKNITTYTELLYLDKLDSAIIPDGGMISVNDDTIIWDKEDLSLLQYFINLQTLIIRGGDEDLSCITCYDNIIKLKKYGYIFV